MKIKILLILSVFLLPILKGQTQDTISCVHNQFLQEFQDSNSRVGDISKIISYGTKRFREKNPNLQLYPKPYPKPQPAPSCEMCMTIDPSCFKSKYALPVIVHIVAQTIITNILLNRELPIQNIFSLFF